MTDVEKSCVYMVHGHLPDGQIEMGWISAHKCHSELGEPSPSTRQGVELVVEEPKHTYTRIDILSIKHWHTLEVTYDISPVLRYLGLWDDKAAAAYSHYGRGHENIDGQAVTTSVYGVTLRERYRVYLFRRKRDYEACARQLAKAA
ncbi:hypothetical protein [Methylobacterium gregans]|uniref:hypothetical protein n=1 Tax=Methylobacterium gregans TaxID=374424 RepID=UPI001EE341B3|nr:hypothetical protein [Methylobacterium gregans]MDQ0518862.1 hypothetical protein [Methylobacterium gregans]GLS57266.1 hypothetical protein GCM10007886_54520 [Methylobacterium gregans]